MQLLCVSFDPPLASSAGGLVCNFPALTSQLLSWGFSLSFAVQLPENCLAGAYKIPGFFLIGLGIEFICKVLGNWRIYPHLGDFFSEFIMKVK